MDNKNEIEQQIKQICIWKEFILSIKELEILF